MTEYVILRRDPGALPAAWHQIDGVFRASSAKRALDGADLTIPGEYVATPVRSWRPIPVAIDQITKVTIG